VALSLRLARFFWHCIPLPKHGGKKNVSQALAHSFLSSEAVILRLLAAGYSCRKTFQLGPLFGCGFIWTGMTLASGRAKQKTAGQC